MIFNMNSGEGKKVPVLKDAYPQDITVTAGDNATFVVLVEKEGKPAGYTYTWYVNGSVVEGAKSQNYIRDTSEDKGVLTVYCEVTNKAGTVASRVASLTIQHNLTVRSNAGATVTATKDEETVSGTCDASGSVTLALTDGTWTVEATIDSASNSTSVVVDSHNSISLLANTVPVFTYTGDYKIVDGADAEITASSDNWKIRLLTSGTLTFSELNGAADGIDVFCVGGGGGGTSGNSWGGGAGGGGYTKTAKGVAVTTTTAYAITIGAGSGSQGGATSAFDVSASGGSKGTASNGGKGGSGGGSGGAAGGSNGGSGGTYSSDGGVGGSGQGSTTREFGESNGTLYAGGGGGGGRFTETSAISSKSGGSGGGGYGGGGNGGTNTGGGGGGKESGSQNTAVGSGGSGIVVIRNKR